MLNALASVGSFTLLSRITGFARDAVMASVLGAGPLADAFLIAFRLPNHFRAIFAEGAFNAAFLPLYAKLKAQEGLEAAKRLADDIFAWQLLIQGLILAGALLSMPSIIALLAPGFADDPAKMALAAELTRITFPYLICIAIVTQMGAMLNADDKFKAAAAAPVLLNIAMIGTLLIAARFPSAAHAAAWGVFAGGVLELILLVAAGLLSGLVLMPRLPSLSVHVRTFAVNFFPAVIGAMGVQLALFVDTILASFLAAGELSSLYYADRINQLPLGVIGIALGTVLLPEMSRRIAQGRTVAAAYSQNRAVELGLFLTLPCMAAFLTVPDAIMRGLFARGAFDAQAAAASADVLQAYALGLPAFVLLRSATPIFHARGDTVTPVVATAIAIAANLALKLWLVLGLSMGATGLALGTAAGAWINLIVLLVAAGLSGHLRIGRHMRILLPRIILANMILGLGLGIALQPLSDFVSSLPSLRAEALLALLVFGAGFVYVALAAGTGLLRLFRIR